MSDPITGGTGDALADAIGGLFELPEVDLDNQMAEMASGDTSYQESTVQESQNNETNAYEKDDALDAALIDMLPF